MGFLSGFLSPGLTAVTGAVGAYQGARAEEADKAKKEALQQAMLLRQQHQDEIINALHQAQTQGALRSASALRLGDPGYPEEKAKEAGAVEGAKTPALVDRAEKLIAPKVKEATQVAGAVAPIHTKEAVATAQQVQPIIAANAPPIAAVGPDGKPTFVTRHDALGMNKPTTGSNGALAAPMAAKVGQAGEMLKKMGDLLPMMEQLDVGAGQSASQDLAAHGIGVAGHAIPGTKGIGSLLVNQSPTYSAYQAALSPFILAAAHALSGARINNEQIEQIRSSVEVKPGDWNNAEVRAQKKKNLLDLVNSIIGSLPADAIAAQEDQMDKAHLEMLRGNGYRGAHRATAPTAPTAATSSGNVDLRQPSHAQQLWDKAVAQHGEQKVLQEYGPRPEDEE